jgi:large subunit ribosomal protein L1
MGKTKTAFVGGAPAEEKKKQKKIHLSGLKGGQRIKMVEAAPTEEVPAETIEKAGGPERVKRAERIRSKKYQEAKKKFDNTKAYTIKEAVKLVKDTSYSKFDGTFELHLIVKKAGTSASVTLPFQAGKTKKIEIADEGTIKKLTEGKIDFDVLIATPAIMPKLVPFARILGPKGLMPNPKNGTLVSDPKKAQGFSANSTTLKTEPARNASASVAGGKEAQFGLIHTVVGKVGQDEKELAANIEAVLKALGGEKQIVRVYAKATMGPSVRIKLS